MQSFHSGLYTFKLQIYILHVKHANQQAYKRYICKQFYVTRMCIDRLLLYVYIITRGYPYKVFHFNTFKFVKHLHKFRVLQHR